VIASPFILGVLLSTNIVPTLDRFLHHHGLISIGSTLNLILFQNREKPSSSTKATTTTTTGIYSDVAGLQSGTEEERIRFNNLFDQVIGKDVEGDDPFVDLTLRVHLNGDSEACATSNDASVNLSTGNSV
jgi:hypothetical protein